MADDLDALEDEVRLNIGRGTGGVADVRIHKWINWAIELIASLHTFEEMRLRIHNPVVEDCEDAWVAKTNVTSTADGTYYKRGTYSAKHVVATAFTTGIVATEVVTSFNFTDYTHLRFWARSSTAAAAKQIRFLLDDHALCASPTETLNMGALVADIWSEQTLKLAAPSSNKAVISVGVDLLADAAAQDIYIDDVRAVRCTEKDIKTYNFPTRVKNVYDITLQDGTSSRKLVYVQARHFDAVVPRSRADSSDTPVWYVDHGTTFDLYPIPDDVYPLIIRFGQFPIALSAGADVPALLRKDELIVTAATAIGLSSIHQHADATIYWRRAFGQRKDMKGGLMQVAIAGDHSAEDWIPVARPFSTSFPHGLSFPGKYSENPFYGRSLR